MSVESGRELFAGAHPSAADRQRAAEQPLDAVALRRSGVARGRAMHRARGDRAAAEAVEIALAPPDDVSSGP